MRTGRGFTLVEVLTAIAIVAIVMLIVFGAYGAAKRQSLIATCVSNQRQIAVAVQLYAEDHGGWHPERLSATRTYGTARVLYCPADPYRKEGGLWRVLYSYADQSQLARLDETTYGYLFGPFGQYQYELPNRSVDMADPYPVLLLCLAHVAAPSPLGLSTDWHGPVVRTFVDGSVHVNRLEGRGQVSTRQFSR